VKAIQRPTCEAARRARYAVDARAAEKFALAAEKSGDHGGAYMWWGYADEHYRASGYFAEADHAKRQRQAALNTGRV
jgi:hypothetical protein